MSIEATPPSRLLVVRGAELISADRRSRWVVWPGWERKSAEVQLWERVWRFLGPKPMKVLGGERFKSATRTHWVVLAKDFLWMVVAWPFMFLVSFLYTWVGFPNPWQLQLIAWTLMVVHQVLMIHKMLAWRAKLLVTTDKRLVVVGGVFTNWRKEYNLLLYTNFSVYQSYWMRLLGYGIVRIEMGGSHDDGSKNEFLMYVPDPDQFCDDLHTYITVVDEYLYYQGS